MNNHKQSLEVIAAVLIRAFWIGAAFMIFSMVTSLVLNDWAFEIHSRMLNVSRDAFDLFLYGWFGLLKLIVTLFFLVPYLAIKMVLKKM